MAMDRKNAPCCAVPPGQHSMYRLMKNARCDLRRHIEELRRHPGDEFLMGQQGMFHHGRLVRLLAAPQIGQFGLANKMTSRITTQAMPT